MAENKRNKKYSKLKESKRPVILTKRDVNKNDKSQVKPVTEQIQPKILLKVRDKEPVSQHISIVTREHSLDPTTAPSPNAIGSHSKETESPQNLSIEQPLTFVPSMTRPITLITSVTFQVNANSMRVLMKNNLDFFVVGVIGTQGAGKSTLLNLLATDSCYFDVYNNLFKDKGGFFPIKFKPGKASSMPRTESVHMFITKDRMILLDCPPVLCNSYKRDAATNELDDIKMIIFLLTVCHLVIVVQEDHLNLNLIRLLQFAELTKPHPDGKTFVNDYFPNILFVKNRAKRNDFLPKEKQRVEKILRGFFKDSQLKVLSGQNEKLKRSKQTDADRNVSYFIFPEVTAGRFSSYCLSLENLVNELRNLVFMSPRNPICSGTTDFTEALWFEMLTTAALNKNQFFLTTYEEVRRCHTHSGSDQAGKTMNYVDSIE